MVCVITISSKPLPNEPIKVRAIQASASITLDHHLNILWKNHSPNEMIWQLLAVITFF